MQNNYTKKRKKRSLQTGFTLVEMMVAMSLFAVVMTISTSALLSMVDANRKAQSLQSVMNNLNVTLDGMVRGIRMGGTYHCGDIVETNKTVLSTRTDCVAGGNLLSFEAFGNSSADVTDQWVYWFEDGRLYKSVDARNTALPLTAPEIQIDSFKVFVTGAQGTLNRDGDIVQPKVVISIQGTAGAEGNTSGVIGTSGKIRTTFNIQAVASQRILDL
ncbi:hypothetical protein CL644_00605 [bacterium]|nr:hypothetical protein [bacterium]|tara:strand:- start:22286 stop:22933 length:648 start_codon:yes stop_codon:yes gene_type:complete